MGIAATGKQAAITGTVIDRIVNGQLQEEWENWDALGLMQQHLHWGRPLGNCYPNRESCQARDRRRYPKLATHVRKEVQYEA